MCVFKISDVQVINKKCYTYIRVKDDFNMNDSNKNIKRISFQPSNSIIDQNVFFSLNMFLAHLLYRMYVKSYND